MPFLNLTDSGGYFCFDEAECRASGQASAEAYRSADPFPHIVIDDFLDAGLLRQIVRDFPDGAGKTHFMRNQERLKCQFHPRECSGLATRNLFAELNSQAFLAFLAEMTGIEGLIADSYFNGAGLHETRRGGHLGIHADFSRHDVMNLERRLNLLIYLNDDWAEAYGGALELWDRDMSDCRRSILPTLGRAVIFATDSDSYHGHPDPLICPDNRTRRSIATYYYTVPEAMWSAPDRGTRFRVRPNSADKRDWGLMLDHLVREWTPPVLHRRLRL